jgi:uncharacterized damage-inducible protein DinB
MHMRTTISIVGISLALTSGSVVAQQPAGSGQPQAIAGGLRMMWDGAAKNVRESATLMPDFGFRPPTEKSPDGNQVRTFGQILAHLAGANYVICAAARGEKSPYAEDHFEKSATTREAILPALAGSITYCDDAFKADDRRLAETVAMPFDMGKAPRAAVLVMNIGHVNEHYGNLVTYFRIKGIVPPSSRR